MLEREFEIACVGEKEKEKGAWVSETEIETRGSGVENHKWCRPQNGYRLPWRGVGPAPHDL